MLAMNTSKAIGQDPDCSNTSTPLMMVSRSSSRIVRVFITGRTFAGMYNTAAPMTNTVVTARL